MLIVRMALFVFFLLFSYAVSAGTYTLVNNHDFEICRKMATYIEGKETQFSYACELPVPDTDPDIKKLQWTPMGLDNYEYYVANALNSGIVGQGLTQEEKIEQSQWLIDIFKKNIGRGAKIEYSTLQFSRKFGVNPISVDHHPIKIFKVTFQSCKPDSYKKLIKSDYYFPLYYIEDVDALESISPNSSKQGEIFQYKGYYYSHSIGGYQGKNLYVEMYSTSFKNLHVSPLCKFRLSD